MAGHWNPTSISLITTSSSRSRIFRLGPRARQCCSVASTPLTVVSLRLP
jgi:hypothetical protein